MKTPQAQSPSASRQRNAAPPPVLPDDLMVEILSWLPVKSLVKFRCVCRLWKSLISDPKFVKLHLRRSSRNHDLLLLRDRDRYSFEDTSLLRYSVRSLLGNPSPTIDEDDCYPLTNYFGSEFVGSCNGLVCLRHYIFKQRFYLCNPATKLISSKFYLRNPAIGAHSYYRCAFGYDNLSGTYKVVAFVFDRQAKVEVEKIQVKICTFGDNCWRNIDSFVPFDSGIPRWNNGLYFNGTLNWLALRNNNYTWDDTSTIAQLIIVSLDLRMETCTQFLLPHLDESPLVEPTIGVLMDCLCFSHDCKQTHFVIWQMKEFGVEKSWTQFVKVSYQDLQIDCLKYPLLPLCISENGDVLILTSNLSKSQATRYHRRDNRVDRIELPNPIHWNRTMDYVESLVSPCCY